MNDDLMKAWEELNQEIIACRKCPRLVQWREEVAQKRRRAYRDQVYWGKPLPGFGDVQARVQIVGLAPGAHGSNRTGRMFTGDSSGVFLYRALFNAGFANQAECSHVQDGLALKDIFISAVCRCVPPGNKPLPAEIAACLPFVERENRYLGNPKVMVALGKIAYDQVVGLFRKNGELAPIPDFGHGVTFISKMDLPILVASYHPSQQNTQTGRLTESMFMEVWDRVNSYL